MDIKFTELGLRPELIEGIRRLGFESPSPIQAKTIPVAISGKDIIGLSETGSGKTAAFGLPALNQIKNMWKIVQIKKLDLTGIVEQKNFLIIWQSGKWKKH